MTPNNQAPAVVDAAMVERAQQAFNSYLDPERRSVNDAQMRAALEAALLPVTGAWDTGRTPGKVTQHWLRTAFERIAAGESEADVLADYGYVAGAGSEAVDEGEQDAAVWTLLDLMKRCGAEEDAGDDGTFWTLTLDQVYSLEAALSRRNVTAYEATHPAPAGLDAGERAREVIAMLEECLADRKCPTNTPEVVRGALAEIRRLTTQPTGAAG